MSNIALKIGTSCDPETTMRALNTIDGLSTWWTSQTEGSTNIGEIINFKFGEAQVDMKVISSTPEMVVWECVSGPDEWIGTQVEFKLVREPETTLFFRHKGWAEESPFFHHCSMKWAVFLLSLKRSLEEGNGHPFPDDIHITNSGH